jgi:hypothetical protein
MNIFIFNFQVTKNMKNMNETKQSEKKFTCGQCKYAELQCPPVVRCKLTGKYMYLDDPTCDKFEPL